jgi:DNA-directed RNA polymerase subunit RPC12/RpoP
MTKFRVRAIECPHCKVAWQTFKAKNIKKINCEYCEKKIILDSTNSFWLNVLR